MSLGNFLAAIILSALARSDEDWKHGDLAVCVKADGSMPDSISPKEGDYLRVTNVCGGGLFLHFEGKPGDRHWLAAHFRKVKPDADPAADEEWVEQIKRMRPKVHA
ncbi:hypothetical protein FIM10_04195 [Sphingomonadales bacterium 56]|uniref:hypothetical protein n=1 Tax=unclassified Sphingobium TaxID=2611147 RepID=UPI00191AB641|nr:MULTISPECIES: hypothetical protein [unclassified Sphingobium]MBY2927877.1 hypothetical protein [Sphingomonadales bacterium 56]MBY2957977.1 hypothetical protein [Sphingomonadales bacterium 58]CAD7336120.1 hypothetical protein SPHS6_00851 [Sphingobium sp. S6]CAD7336185.1 hypothetical protein SPHS8_00892 [Sphingobium sp. S8]